MDEPAEDFFSQLTQKLCSMCKQEATYVNKKRRLCDKHYRLSQMRDSSRERYGLKHRIGDLEVLLPKDMKCPLCKREMRWRRKTNERGVTNQITIQHWRDGSIGFLCNQCNTRHFSMEGDSFKDIPTDHKFCPKCQIVKHESMFCLKNSRSVLKRNSYCKSCANIRSGKWQKENKDRYNTYQRERNKKIKEMKKEAHERPANGFGNGSGD